MHMPRTRFAKMLAAGLVVSAGVVLAQRGPQGPQMRGDGPAPAAKPFSVTRSDPGMDAVAASDTKAELIASGFGLNEGPVWVPDPKGGYLLVGALLENVIYKVTPAGKVSVFLEKAGYSGPASEESQQGFVTRSGRAYVLLVGPSCASLDSQGRLIWCADNDRTVNRLEKDGTRTVLSTGVDGKRFSGPNDIVVAKNDGVYLTDNDFGMRDGPRNPSKQMDASIVLIKDGKSRIVLDGKTLGGIPNGVVLSPDEKTLYANAGQRMFKYEVKPDGSLGPGAPFTDGPGIGDGMKVDTAGNVYSTSGAGPGIVRVTSPAGKLLGYLNLPLVDGEPKRQICATNIAFGDADGHALYVTACDAVYRIRLKATGVMPGPKSVTLPTPK